MVADPSPVRRQLLTEALDFARMGEQAGTDGTELFLAGFDLGVEVALADRGLAEETQRAQDPIEREVVRDFIRILEAARTGE